MLPFQEDFSLLLSVQSFLLLASNLPDTLFRDRQIFRHCAAKLCNRHSYSRYPYVRLQFLQPHHILHPARPAEHINALHLLHLIPLLPKQRRVARLRATLQLTYTTRFGAACAIASITAGSTPLRGGSITITSGRKPSATSFGSSASAAPQRKFTFPMPLRTAFSFAFSIACGTISMPSASRQWRAIISVIVPAPQYTSHRRSSPVSSANPAPSGTALPSAPD